MSLAPADYKALLDRIEKLNAIGIGLSSEHDADRLLEMILLGAKQLTGADGGTLYTLSEQKLHFALVRTDSLRLFHGGPGHPPPDFPQVPLYNPDGTPNFRNVITRAVLEDSIVNVPDAYASADYDFSGTRAFDARTGYRSVSFLCVPMKDHEGRIIGALQLINAIDPAGGGIIPFTQTDERLVASLASQAAVTLTRRQLIEDLKNLLQALVRLIATAIDEKSPYTGGHCRRVPALTMLLAQAVNRSRQAPFAGVTFSEKELHELEMAAWLHDCGKIITPEHVVDKHTKLEAVFDRIHLVDARIDLLAREAELAFWQKKAAALEEGRAEEIPDLKEALDRELTELEADREFIRRCNSGTEGMREEDKQRIVSLAARCCRSGQPLLTGEEVHNLLVSRGTLTDEERQVVNGHISATIRLLQTLPFPEELHRVPEIAGGHHEKMDGTGYPRGVAGDYLPLQTRILAIADIFEALTAADRPYRRPNSLEDAMGIMGKMCREGHIDPDLFDLFTRERLHFEYARQFLQARGEGETTASAAGRA